MAHDITDTDNMFSVRQVPWHGLGTVLSDYPTLEEARQIAHPWEPIGEPIFRRVPVITDDGDLTETYEEVSESQAIVRSDNSEVLGVVGSGWAPVSNKSMYEIADALEGTANSDGGAPVRIETAGSLRGGRKVWLLVRLEEPIKLKGDPTGDTIPYFAIQNANDGTAAFKGSATMTRIVCQNTLKLSELESKARGTNFTFRHTATIDQRIEMAKNSIALWREGITHYQEVAEILAKAKITKDQREEFIERFHPLPSGLMVTERVQRNVMEARDTMRELFAGPTLEYVADTAHGLVQSAVEYLQHYKKTKGKSDRERTENLFSRSMLDQNALVETAVKMAREIAHV